MTAKSTLKTKQKNEIVKIAIEVGIQKIVKSYFKQESISVQIKHEMQKVNCLKELEIELESLILAQDERWRHA